MFENFGAFKYFEFKILSLRFKEDKIFQIILKFSIDQRFFFLLKKFQVILQNKAFK